VSYERGAPHMLGNGTWGPSSDDVEARKGRTMYLRGPHKVSSEVSKV